MLLPISQQLGNSAQAGAFLGGPSPSSGSGSGSIGDTVGSAIHKTFNSAVDFGHNFLTGDRDYHRQHSLAERQEIFNSAQADKERK